MNTQLNNQDCGVNITIFASAAYHLQQNEENICAIQILLQNYTI